MKNSEVAVGKTYSAKVSGRVVPVRLIANGSRKGWVGLNTATNREIHIKTAAKLRYEVKTAEMARVLGGTL